MTKGIYLALSGAVAEGRALDNVAHNIANANTTGFKAQRMTFEEALEQVHDRDATPVAVSDISADPKQGTIVSSGNPLDLAISGEGYFAIETDRGVRYTRAGGFRVDGEGTLVNHDGEAVLDEHGERLVVPADAGRVSVGADGTVHADAQIVGVIGLVAFAPDKLRAEGAQFAPVAGAEPVAREVGGEIVAGALEKSNFEVVHGMVELIRVSRSYEALTRMIEGHKQMDERAARAIGER